MVKRGQNPAPSAFRLLMNPQFIPDAHYDAEAREVVSLERLDAVADELRRWPEYASTPLHRLEELALRCGVSQVFLKDESGRFGLGSFKAIGGAYGSLRVIQAELSARHGIEADALALRSGSLADRTRDIVLACATDGNHGRAVAWAARTFGCGCEVYVPSIVSRSRRQKIEALGARVTRVKGTYDDAVRAVAAAAAERGWVVVSDQSYPGYETVPRDIMQGYAVLAHEVVDALGGNDLPTHVFVQAGVGGFAAAVCGYLWERFGPSRPTFVCVEPLAADCLYRSAAAGRVVAVPGDLDTVMVCLSAGEASLLGWKILGSGAAAFVAVDDAGAVEAMRFLARPGGRQTPLVVGESGAAGVAGLMAVCEDADARRQLELDAGSRVLLFATEGATDEHAYAALVGCSPEEVGRSRHSPLEKICGAV